MVQKLTQNTTGADGTYQLMESTGKIYVYSKKFSTFATAYDLDSTENRVEKVEPVDMKNNPLVLVPDLQDEVSGDVTIDDTNPLILSYSGSQVILKNSDVEITKSGGKVLLTLKDSVDSMVRLALAGGDNCYLNGKLLCGGKDISVSGVQVTKADGSVTVLLTNKNGQPVDLSKVKITVEDKTIGVTGVIDLTSRELSDDERFLEAGETLNVGKLIGLYLVGVSKNDTVRVVVTYADKHVLYDNEVKAV